MAVLIVFAGLVKVEVLLHSTAVGLPYLRPWSITGINIYNVMINKRVFLWQVKNITGFRNVYKRSYFVQEKYILFWLALQKPKALFPPRP